MKRIMVIGVAITVIALIVAACNLGFSSSESEHIASPESPEAPGSPGSPDSPDVLDPVIRGPGALVRIPTVSSRLLSSLNATYVPRTAGSGTFQPQAILFATSADFILRQGVESEPVNQWLDVGVSTNLGQDDGNGGPGDDDNGAAAMLEHFLEIEPSGNEPGDEYTLEVKVYNSHVSTTVPVVAGESLEFFVKAGQSKVVGVTGIPVNPEIISAEASRTFEIVRTPVQFTSLASDPMEDWDMLNFTGIGGEQWIKLDLATPPAEYVRIVVDPSGNADAAMLMYDGDGKSMGDQPALGWGCFANVHGGQGGTRAAVIGNVTELPPPDAAYFGLLLLDRDGSTANGNVSVRVDFVDRPYAPYPNVLLPSAEGPDFENEDFEFEGREPVQQTIFPLGLNDDRPVHWFILKDIDWLEIDWDHDTFEFWIEVKVTFDVFEREHLYGGRWENNGGDPFFEPMLALYIGESVGGNDPEIFSMLTADEGSYTVTENTDFTTTATFRVTPKDHITGLGTTFNPDVAAVAISSDFHGNQFTFEWDAPAGIIVEMD